MYRNFSKENLDSRPFYMLREMSSLPLLTGGWDRMEFLSMLGCFIMEIQDCWGLQSMFFGVLGLNILEQKLLWISITGGIHPLGLPKRSRYYEKITETKSLLFWIHKFPRLFPHRIYPFHLFEDLISSPLPSPKCPMSSPDMFSIAMLAYHP